MSTTDQQRMVNGDGVISVIEPVPVPPPVLTGLVTTDQLNAAVAAIDAQIAAVQSTVPRIAYSHSQGTPSTVWTISHGLGYYPGGIVALDSDGNHVESDIVFVDLNTVQLIHAAPIGGTAKIS